MGVLRFMWGVFPTLFSLKSSYNRPQFWTALSCGLAIFACSILIFHVLPDADPNLQGWIVVLSVTGAYVMLAAGVKRGRERSGRAIIPTFFLIVVTAVALEIFDRSGFYSTPGFLVSAIATGLFAWLIIELGFRGHAVSAQGGWRETCVGVLRFFFGISGTFNRLQYWGAMLVAVAIFAWFIAATNRSESAEQAGVIVWIMPLLALVIVYAAVLKRARDRNGGGVLPLMSSFLITGFSIRAFEKFGFYPGIVVALFGVGLFIWAIVQLGFMGPVEPEPPEPEDWGEDEEDDDGESERAPVN